MDSSYSGLVAHAFECLDQPEKTIAGRIIQAIDAGISLLTLGEELGLSHKEEVLSLTNLPGFEHLSEAQQQQLINIFEMGLDIPTEYIEEIRNIYGRLGVEWTDHLEEIGRYEIKEVNGIWRSKSNERKIREDLSSFYEYDPKQVFSKISCPILLVHSNGNIGTNPPLFLKEHYRDTLVYAKDIHKVTSETNHYTLVFENRPELNSEIKEFLKKIVTNSCKKF